MDNLIDYESTLLDHHLPPFTDYKGLAKDGIRIISKASGNYIFDENLTFFSKSCHVMKKGGCYIENIAYRNGDKSDFDHVPGPLS